MFKTIGVIAVLGALLVAVMVFRGSLQVSANMTEQGKREVSQVRDGIADVVRSGADQVVEKVGD